MTAYGLDMLYENNLHAPQLKNPVSLVLGVVEGDPHDLGKNIISLIYKSFGYQVYDLGAEVPKDLFVKTVLEKNARILGLSAMMSTTMSMMPEIIREVRIVSPDTLVIVGGAPLDEKIAGSFGADGYAESAVTVLEQTRLMLDRTGS
jgi:5-methyltetrahydrofolate--homocysteine methyltransferase